MDCGERMELDRVADTRASTMAFDVVDLSRLDAAVDESSANDLYLAQVGWL